MRSIVLGIGNADRGDDGAGRAVAQRLRSRVPDDVEVLEHDGEATALLKRLQGAAAAIIVDACQSGAPPGTVQRFDVSEKPLPAARFGLSTHGLGLASAIELARALRRLPRHCIVYAIEAECFNVGAGLSSAVTAAVDEVTREILAQIDHHGPPRTLRDA